MFRNIPRVNNLYKRATSFYTVLHSSIIHFFDEQGHTETMSDVLDFSTDIRQCCSNNRIPQVLKTRDSIIVANMLESFSERNDENIYLQWRRGKGLTMFYTTSKGTDPEITDVLFFHFHQWKYVIENQMKIAVADFTDQLYSRNETFLTMKCFDLRASKNIFTITAC